MPHVLVVEDDPHVRRGLLRTLSEHDIAASSAATGLGGLQAAVETHPDLIVLDLGLPDIDGTELLRMVRAISQVPVIVATAHGEEHQIVSALEAGAGGAQERNRAGPLSADSAGLRTVRPSPGERGDF